MICKSSNSKIQIFTEDQAVQLTGDFDNITQGVVITNQEVFYLPHFRRDFRLLSVVNSKLKKISNTPLLSLGSLEYFDVSRNKIKSIPGNLFQLNPSIKVAIFDNNNILAIGTSAFDTLLYLGLQKFSCYSGTAKNKAEVAQAIEEINHECFSFSEDCFGYNSTKMNPGNDTLKELAARLDEIHRDVQATKILTSIILTLLLLAAIIFILYILRTTIFQGFTTVRDKIYTREDDSEIIIEETSSINYASCAHINETFSESTNNMETSAIYDSVYVESVVVEDEKAKVGLTNITPNSTNYASVEEILTHLDQNCMKNDSKVLEDSIVWEKSKLFEDQSNPDITKRILQNQQSHKIGSQSTNAIFEHESLCQANANKSSQKKSDASQKSTDFIKSELTSNGTKISSIPENLPSTPTDSNIPSQELTNSSDYIQYSSNIDDVVQESMTMPVYDLPVATSINSIPNSDIKSKDSPTTEQADNKSLSRQNSFQKSSYKTKIPQSMNPKTLNLANIDEKITHFEQTSPVFADVAQKLMNTSTGSQKPVNHFGFRSLTYADVAQKIGGEYVRAVVTNFCVTAHLDSKSLKKHRDIKNFKKTL